ncbi:chromate transporter [Caldicoprobacter guelmensis]|uniref:chromate transporter n=1 Tax=Caldicoprobacter guelmensis TaxID=1170224 RepID=UPI00195B0081|nr:chromate transporter [Caldicoprobacter guelmensis]MBM7582863.1 chromate transporter [Caldicoprobacter guelmensis]
MNRDDKWKKMQKLFFVFFRIGAFTFGGGLAMIPFIKREIVDSNHWIEEEEIVDIFAMVQSVPGVIAVNSAIFVGYRIAGIWGALASAIGVVLPSFIVISVIALFFSSFKSIPVVANAFEGVSAGVVALIITALVQLIKPSIKDEYGWTIAVFVFAIMSLTNISAIYVLLASAVVGIVISYIKKRREA